MLYPLCKCWNVMSLWNAISIDLNNNAWLSNDLGFWLFNDISCSKIWTLHNKSISSRKRKTQSVVQVMVVLLEPDCWNVTWWSCKGVWWRSATITSSDLVVLILQIAFLVSLLSSLYRWIAHRYNPIGTQMLADIIGQPIYWSGSTSTKFGVDWMDGESDEVLAA